MAPRRSMPRERSTPTWPGGSSGPKRWPTRTCSSSVRWPRRARPVGCGLRERPTGFTTATWWRSSSAAEPRAASQPVGRSVQSVAVRIEVCQDRAIVDPLGLGFVVVIIVIVVGVGQLDLELGQEVAIFLGRDIDRGGQRGVADVDGNVLALELDGDGLDEGILDIAALDPAADRLDELEELLGLPFRFADHEDVRVDLVVAFMQLEEEHVDSLMRSVWAGEYTSECRSTRWKEAREQAADRGGPRRFGEPRLDRRR